ncbi:MAG: Mrp/NBP35 family ATP-binding protein [Acidimicrobiia bacterium]
MDAAEVRAAVGAVPDKDFHRPLGDLDMLARVDASAEGAVDIVVAVPVHGHPLEEDLRADVIAAADRVSGVTSVRVEFAHMTAEERATLMQRVRGGADTEIAPGAATSTTRVIAVSSGKGGVGKSSVTANLGISLARLGKSVGIIDADVWGFSIPKMLGVDRAPSVIDDTLIPPRSHGVSAMSMDFFVQPDQAVIWRGPMLHKALEQFLADVYWGEPDYLLIDMPPGTGDVAISISQFVPRAQAIIVTTPQVTAQRVAKRAGLMARQVKQDIMGVIENMSWFTGHDGTRYPIFGTGGGEALAAELDVPLLGQIPLLPALREGADLGLPVTVTEPDGEAAAAFDGIATEVESRRPRLRAHPELVVR